MNLAEELLAGPPPRTQCHTGAVLRRLDDDMQAAVLAALANPDVQSTHIARTLTKYGHKVSQHSVQRHRRGECGCEASP